MNLLSFFTMGGVILIVSGGLQVLVRPRKPSETALERLLNAATLRAVLFVTVGVLAVLVGTGVVPFARLRF